MQPAGPSRPQRLLIHPAYQAIVCRGFIAIQRFPMSALRCRSSSQRTQLQKVRRSCSLTPADVGSSRASRRNRSASRSQRRSRLRLQRIRGKRVRRHRRPPHRRRLEESDLVADRPGPVPGFPLLVYRRMVTTQESANNDRRRSNPPRSRHKCLRAAPPANAQTESLFRRSRICRTPFDTTATARTSLCSKSR